jgi:DNA-binding transcriptional ArsR family regulator
MNMSETLSHPNILELTYATAAKARGRRALVRATGITESTVRTALRKLERAGYVTMDREGTHLTDAGRTRFAALLDRVFHLGSLSCPNIALDAANDGALVRRAAVELQSSIEFRDAAVRGGASGAVLLGYSFDGWVFADSRVALRSAYEEDVAELNHACNTGGGPKPGDGVIIAFGATQRAARSGLWQTIATLLERDAVQAEGSSSAS